METDAGDVQKLWRPNKLRRTKLPPPQLDQCILSTWLLQLLAQSQCIRLRRRQVRKESILKQDKPTMYQHLRQYRGRRVI